ALILGIAWMIGGFIGKATVNKPFIKRLSFNITFQISIVLFMILSLNFVTNIYSLIGFAFLIHAAAGFTFNNYFTYCLSRFPKNAGISSGLTGGLTYVLVSFLSYFIIQGLPAKDEAHLSYSYLILTVLSVIIMYIIYNLNKRVKVGVN
ncbi:MAG: MFS transporter, partial [Bacteroidetes bacterium]|nr:MFS transporter [Bacteroidota bacterium]